MKTNTYILLTLLLSFSFGIAQSDVNKIEENKVISVSVNGEEVTTVKDNAVKTVKENETVLIDAKELRESIARTSDIRLYLNRVRKVQNIKMLFPKINKPVKA
ncbi:hypothetical protein Q4Q39_18460 [Flavivirga amylovorans]|uniref:DUF2807 domain-containing protein n=1 Tax=Flavivirga amylovorans TaxID=870486 RepID=A0ABT8X6T3_9FLAO|nr:hypothetical protein [Flavivirga amylovorans]MDO5989392.1 hypothetical protein [Flavivirga amylovorans]